MIAPFSLTSHHITGNAIFLSDKAGCPILGSFFRDISSDGCSQANKVTLDGTNLVYNADEKFQETVCIKAFTLGVTDSSLLFKLTLTVCGNE